MYLSLILGVVTERSLETRAASCEVGPLCGGAQ